MRNAAGSFDIQMEKMKKRDQWVGYDSAPFSILRRKHLNLNKKCLTIVAGYALDNGQVAKTTA